MKHIKSINELFGKPKNGDVIMQRLLDIIKEENIEVIKHPNGNLEFKIDDKIYECIDYQTGFLTKDCKLVVMGQSRSRDYNFSSKFWNELKKINKSQEILKKDKYLSKDLEDIDDTKRTAKKYNL